MTARGAIATTLRSLDDSERSDAARRVLASMRDVLNLVPPDVAFCDVERTLREELLAAVAQATRDLSRRSSERRVHESVAEMREAALVAWQRGVRELAELGVEVRDAG